MSGVRPSVVAAHPDELAELLEDFADAAAAREARISIDAGSIVWSGSKWRASSTGLPADILYCA